MNLQFLVLLQLLLFSGIKLLLLWSLVFVLSQIIISIIRKLIKPLGRHKHIINLLFPLLILAALRTRLLSFIISVPVVFVINEAVDRMKSDRRKKIIILALIGSAFLGFLYPKSLDDSFYGFLPYWNNKICNCFGFEYREQELFFPPFYKINCLGVPYSCRPGGCPEPDLTEEQKRIKADLTEEEKEIIEGIKSSTPFCCHPLPIPGKVEVYFKTDDPYFSEEDAKKIVKSFSFPVEIVEKYSSERNSFRFDLTNELTFIANDKGESILNILEAKFKKIPKFESSEIESFNLSGTAEGVEIKSSELFVLFTFKEKITPAEAEDFVRTVCPTAVVLYDKRNVISFILKVSEGKERELVFFLRENPKVKQAERMFTSCPVP